jgi:murein L,D-transpeptidase YcbB/YkuD
MEGTMSLPRLLKPLALLLALSPAATRADALLQATLEALREADDGVVLVDTELAAPRLIADFYTLRAYAPAWSRPEQVRALKAAAEASAADGLVPADFQPQILERYGVPGVIESLSARERIAAELVLTDALLRYVYQIRFGRLDPVAVNPAWNHRRPIPSATLIESMEQVLSAADTRAALAEVAPAPYFYQALKEAYARVAAAEHLRGLPEIPGGEHLAEGSRNQRVALLRERLVLLGDASAADSEAPEHFDADLRDSVVAFQRRFGLGADGVVGPSTLRTLNQPYDTAKAARLRINLERMRWFYDDLPADFVLVDIAGFMAHVIRDGNIDWSTRVVVGTPEAQTPAFRDEMEYLVFNPTWTVPPSIQKKMRGASSRYKVVDRRTGRTVRPSDVSNHRRYALVQQPGPGNALGRVKFMFPNGHAIYLHDTPSKGLFSHSRRTYSHGCVRVQDPLKLAEVILNKPAWNQNEINRVLRTNRTRDVRLEEHLPVLLYYLTAKVESDGKLTYRSDVYGRDPAIKRAIEGPPSPLRIAFPKLEPIPVPEQPAKSDDTAPTPEPTQPMPGQDSPAPAVQPQPGVTLTQGTAPPASSTLKIPSGAPAVSSL